MLITWKKHKLNQIKLLNVSRFLVSGVTCYDIGNGYRCGPCPLGLTGDGTRDGCRPFRPSCDSNPCFPGVECSDTSDGYTCGPCPEGYHGNGTQCQDINEVI